MNGVNRLSFRTAVLCYIDACTCDGARILVELYVIFLREKKHSSALNVKSCHFNQLEYISFCLNPVLVALCLF